MRVSMLRSLLGRATATGLTLFCLCSISPLAHGQAPPIPAFTGAPTYVQPAAYKVDPSTPSLTIQYSLGPLNFLNGQFPMIVSGGSGTKKIVIDTDTTYGVVPSSADVSMTLVYGKNMVEIPITIPAVLWHADPGAYVIEQAQLDHVADTVVSAINALHTGFDSDTPLTVQSPVTLSLKPTSPAGFSFTKVDVDSPIEVSFKQVLPNAHAFGQAAASGQAGTSPQASVPARAEVPVPIPPAPGPRAKKSEEAPPNPAPQTPR